MDYTGGKQCHPLVILLTKDRDFPLIVVEVEGSSEEQPHQVGRGSNTNHHVTSSKSHLTVSLGIFFCSCPNKYLSSTCTSIAKSLKKKARVKHQYKQHKYQYDNLHLWLGLPCVGRCRWVLVRSVCLGRAGGYCSFLRLHSSRAAPPEALHHWGPLMRHPAVSHHVRDNQLVVALSFPRLLLHHALSHTLVRPQQESQHTGVLKELNLKVPYTWVIACYSSTKSKLQLSGANWGLCECFSFYVALR